MSSRKNLTIDHMVELSAKWLDPNRDRPILESDPVLTSPLILIDRATNSLLELRKQAGIYELEKAMLTAQLTQDDALHDGLARGISYILLGGEAITVDPDEVDVYQTARMIVLPDGLSVTQRSYREQAGAARRVDQRLDAETRAWLEGIVFHGRTLLSVTEEWLATAKRIGENIAIREELEGDNGPGAVSARDLNNARNLWIRGVNNLIDLLRESDLDAEVRRKLLVNLYQAEAQAGRSSSREPAPVEPVEPEAPVEPDVPEPA